MVPLQQMEDQDLEPVLELPPLALHQAFELLGDVLDVQRGKPPGAQMRHLLGQPGDVVGVVERRLSSAFAMGTASCRARWRLPSAHASTAAASLTAARPRDVPGADRYVLSCEYSRG